MRLYKILKKPVTTEKTSPLESKNSCYTVLVSPSATKIDIKKSISTIYWLEVSKVNILNTREKFKNWRKWIQFRQRTSKKAYITLKDKKAKIDFSIPK